MIDVTRYVKFLKKHKLTQSQFFLLYCLYKKEIDALHAYTKLYPNEDNYIIGKGVLDDLLARKYLIKVGKTNDSNSFVVTSKFTDAFIDKYEAVEELLDAYPSMYYSGGKSFPLTSINKDTLANGYVKIMYGSVEEHKEIIDDILYAREFDMIKVKIDTFVLNGVYKTIRKQRKETDNPENKKSVDEY